MVTWKASIFNSEEWGCARGIILVSWLHVDGIKVLVSVTQEEEILFLGSLRGLLDGY